jgi:hypothetical protein
MGKIGLRSRGTLFRGGFSPGGIDMGATGEMMRDRRRFWAPLGVCCAVLTSWATAHANPGPPTENVTTLLGLLVLAMLTLEVIVVYIPLARWFRFTRFVGVYLLSNVATWAALFLLAFVLHVEFLGLLLLELGVVLTEAAILVGLGKIAWLGRRESKRLSWRRALGVSTAGNATSLIVGWALIPTLTWGGILGFWFIVLALGFFVEAGMAYKHRSKEMYRAEPVHLQ